MNWEVAAFYISEDSSGVLYFNLQTQDEAEYLARSWMAEHPEWKSRLKVDRSSSTVLILVD